MELPSKSNPRFAAILFLLWGFAHIQEAKGSLTENPPLSWTENWHEHREILTRVYLNEYVAFYFDSNVNRSLNWPYDDIHQIWKHVQITYALQPNSNSTDQRLYIVIHERRSFSGIHTSTFSDASHGYRNVIDCAQTISVAEKCSVGNLIEKILQIIWNIASRTKEWPGNAYNIWDTWTIFWHDIRTNTHLQYQDSVKVGADHWVNVLKWYRPLYSQYWGSKVVKNFIKLIETYAEGNGNFLDSELNLGSLVYIWSQAAGEDLRKLARGVFPWTNLSEIEFESARKRYSGYTYPEQTTPKEKETQNTSSLTEYTNVTKTTIPTPSTVNATNTEKSTLDLGTTTEKMLKEARAENSTKKGSTPEAKHANMTLIIILPVAIIFIVMIIAFFIFHRRQINVIRAEIRELKPSEIKEFYDGSGSTGNISGYSQIQSAPFNKEFEIPKQNLEINNDKILGSGQYGLVLKGRLLAPGVGGKKPKDEEVAVKTPKLDVDVTTFKALLSELKIIGYLGSHEHVAALRGAVTVNIRNRELFVALEYCDQGDLLSVLKSRKNFTDLFNNKRPLNGNDNAHSSDLNNYLEMSPINVKPELQESKEDTTKNLQGIFSTRNLLEWSLQIADGMAFISSKDVIHGDLAARNILITADNVAKISDFGLSRQLVNYSNYLKKSETPVPWRWMAIESLQFMDFSVKSDVWAFGVTLYEIFTLGAIPYAGANWTIEFVDNLVAGHRLSKPAFANDDVYSLMMGCMRSEASERISFAEAFQKLMEIQSTHCTSMSTEASGVI